MNTGDLLEQLLRGAGQGRAALLRAAVWAGCLEDCSRATAPVMLRAAASAIYWVGSAACWAVARLRVQHKGAPVG